MPIPTIQGQAGLLTDPEIRFTSTNKPVANVRVAFNDSKYNDQTRQWENVKSFYVDCTAWEHVAERLAEHFRKGDQVYVEGRIETEEWEHEGQKRSKPNLTIRTIRKFAQAPQQSQGFQASGQPITPAQAFPNHQQPSSAPVAPTAGGGWNAPANDPWAGGGTPQQGVAPF